MLIYICCWFLEGFSSPLSLSDFSSMTTSQSDSWLRVASLSYPNSSTPYTGHMYIGLYFPSYILKCLFPIHIFLTLSSYRIIRACIAFTAGIIQLGQNKESLLHKLSALPDMDIYCMPKDN